jgi:predicted DNA-binding protein YlxM (UPF0122 family)
MLRLAKPSTLPAPRAADDWIWEAVARLPGNQRAAIALHYLEDRSFEEIAAILDVAPATARVHLHRRTPGTGIRHRTRGALMSESDIQNSFRHLQEDVVGNLETEERLAEITQRRGGMRPALVAFAGGAAVVLIIGAALFAFRSSGNTATLPPATGTAAPETTSALSTTTLAPTTTTPSTAATTTTVGTPTTEAVPLDPQLTEIDSALRAAAAATLDAPEVTSLALYYGEGGAFTTSLWIDHRANGDSFVFDAHAGGTDAATLIVDGER